MGETCQLALLYHLRYICLKKSQILKVTCLLNKLLKFVAAKVKIVICNIEYIKCIYLANIMIHSPALIKPSSLILFLNVFWNCPFVVTIPNFTWQVKVLEMSPLLKEIISTFTTWSQKKDIIKNPHMQLSVCHLVPWKSTVWRMAWKESLCPR